VSWRIYYADGSTFDAAQGAPEAAPRYGVLAVLHDGVIEHGFDWYLRQAGAWVGVKGDASLILKCLHRVHEIDAVFAGESVTNDVFAPVLAQVVKDQGK
jgi:hypothetical protein